MHLALMKSPRWLETRVFFRSLGRFWGRGIPVSCHLVRQVSDIQLAGCVASGHSPSASRTTGVDDSTERNGPLRVLPRSHTGGVLCDEEIERLIPETDPVECVVRKGGILAMCPLLIHSSSKSQEDSPRRVLHIEYAASMFPAEGLELAVA